MLSLVNRPNLSIQAEPAGSLYAWRVETDVYTWRCAANIQGGYRFESHNGTYRHDWLPSDVSFVDADNHHDWLMTIPSIVGQVSGSTIVFDAGWGEIRFEAQSDRIKQQTILKQALRAPDSALVNPLTAMLSLSGQITLPAGVSIYAQKQMQTGDFMTYGPIELRDASNTAVQVFDWISATDEKGHVAHGGYRIHTDAAGNRFIYESIPAQWLAVAEGVITIDPTTVATGTSLSVAWPGRDSVVASNGNIVQFYSNSGTSYYAVSTDNNATYSAPVSTGTPFGAVCIDSADYIYIFTGPYLYVGTPNAGRTSWTWGAGIAVGSASAGIASCVVHSEGAGWVVHVAYSDGGGPWYVYYGRITLDSNHSNATKMSLNMGPNANGTTQNNQPCVCVDPVAKTLLYGFYIGGNGSSSMWKSTYASGSWSGFTQETGIVGLNSWPQIDCDSQGRFIYTSWSGGTLIVAQRNSDGAYTQLTGAPAVASCYPSITHGPNDDVYVGVLTGSPPNPAYIKYTRSTAAWSAITTIDTVSLAGTNGGNWGVFARSQINFSYATATSVYNYRISFNQAPTTPTNLTPANGSGIDLAATSNPFRFTPNDPDATDTVSAYQGQWYDGATLVYDSTKITLGSPPPQGIPITLTVFPGVGTTAGTNVYLGNALVNNKSYTWKVMTWDSSGFASPWSASAAFVTSSAPTVTMSQPAANAVLGSSGLVVAGQYSHATNPIAGIQIVVYAVDGTTVLKDSGPMSWSGAAINYDFSTGQNYQLGNASNYKVKLIVTSSVGLTGSVTNSFSTSFTAPAVPSTTAQANPTLGTISGVIINPTPGGGQPAVNTNTVKRSIDGGVTWVTVATNVTNNGTWTDITCASGQSYIFQVIANASGATTSTSQSTAPVTCNFQGVWVMDPISGVNKNLVGKLAYDFTEQTQQRGELQGFDAYPVIQWGALVARKGRVTGAIVAAGQSQTRWQQEESWRALLTNHNAKYLKDSAGEVVYVDTHLAKYKINMDVIPHPIEIEFSFTEVGPL